MANMNIGQLYSPAMREEIMGPPRRRGGVEGPSATPRPLPTNPALRSQGGKVIAPSEARPFVHNLETRWQQTDRNRQSMGLPTLTEIEQKEGRRAALSVMADESVKFASGMTGAPRSYIRGLIYHETAKSDDPRITPSPRRGEDRPRSSAVGYGQFLDADWDEAWRRWAPSFVTGSQEYDDESRRAAREDPVTAATMVAYRANQAADRLEAALNRPVRQGEVYLEHWLGEQRAITLIKAAERTPNKPAASLFHDKNWREAVESHPGVFLRKGRHATVREVVDQQAAEFGNEPYVRVTPGAPND